ncbi:MAG: uroporphyrinogen-III synthase, partial [Planctomycetaceae bacterium]
GGGVALAAWGAQGPRGGAGGPARGGAGGARVRGGPVGGGGGGEELARAWGEARGRSLLLPQARAANPDLARALRAGGAEVTAVPVYRTVTLEQVDRRALEAAELVCFFAPSAVRAYRALGVSGTRRTWGLGATTRAAMAAAGLRHEAWGS